MTGEVPDPEGQAMNMVNILTGSGAKYLRAAAPRLARYIHQLPETFKLIESANPRPLRDVPTMEGIAYPRRTTDQPFVTFINPASQEKGRTAIHEMLHSLYQRMTGAKSATEAFPAGYQYGYPDVQHTSKIAPGLADKGAKPSWNESLPDYAFRTMIMEAPESGFRHALRSGLGEASVEGMTDMMIKNRAFNLTKGISDPIQWKYSFDAVVDAITRGEHVPLSFFPK